MGTYIALAVSFTIIGGFAYLGMKATDEIITYFNQEVPEKKEKKDDLINNKLFINTNNSYFSNINGNHSITIDYWWFNIHNISST